MNHFLSLALGNDMAANRVRPDVARVDTGGSAERWIFPLARVDCKEKRPGLTDFVIL